jgi:hypothetical protein
MTLREAVFKVVDDEPEFPGEMPDEMKERMRQALCEQDLGLLTEMLRVSVKLTKEGIRERLVTVFDVVEGEQLIEPSDVERASWSDVTRDYVAGLERRVK